MIEMIAVTVVIAVLAAIVVGRLKNDQSGNDFQRGIQSIESAANKAKNKAISTGKTWELTFDSSAQNLKVAESEDQISSSTQSTGTKPLSTKTSSDTNSDSSQGNDAKLGSGWSVATIRKSDGDTESDLLIKFYPDGTADAKSVEFKNSDASVTLKVKLDGSIEVKRGVLAENEQAQEWEAGNIEQRTGQ